MTALYIRTVSTNELPERDGRWKLPEDIDVEKGIAVMEEYAESHGYKDPIIFLDDGYTGTGAIAPAYLFMQQIIKHTNLIDTVIISDLHQINGGMNILMMTNELFTNRGVKLIIAAYNEEAGKLINRYYDEWVETFAGKVYLLVLIGATADKIEACCKKHGFNQIIRAVDLRNAVEICYERAKPGFSVLLSPACASWDMFKSYEERGTLFKVYVNGLEEN